MNKDLDVNASVSKLVESAHCLQDQTKHGLASLATCEKHEHKDNVNPNRNKYRIMWQAAYSAVMSKLKLQKEMRAKWARSDIHSYCADIMTSV